MQVIGSPFEADAQCSHLVRLGIADAAATTDSDLYVFGCPLTLYQHLSNSSKLGSMVRTRKTCCETINSMTAIEVVWMTCLCGCDYINNLQGCGIDKAISIVKEWRSKSQQDRQTMLTEMESTGKWPKSANQELLPTGSTGAPGFVARFNLAVAAFMAHRVSM